MQSAQESHSKKWRPFEEARQYVRSLGLKSQKEWYEYVKAGNKPDDIPSNARNVYKAEWVSWGDWLGTGKTQPWRPFEEARQYVRSLGLDNRKQWQEYAKAGNKPDDIPSDAYSLYKAEWVSWGDWLGTGNTQHRTEQWRSFEEAREFARSLGLQGQKQWREYVKAGDKPDDIPSNADAVYKAEWVSWGDWLGTGRVYRRGWRPFEEAREFARTLDVSSGKEWRAYAKSGRMPKDIPARPDYQYSAVGWSGWGDFLGTGNVPPRGHTWRPFEDAREYVRSLGLKSQKEWHEFAKSPAKPKDIPMYPRESYEAQWVSVGDWLGTGYVATFRREYRSYEDAREHVRSLGLKSQKEWYEYIRSGKLPDDIPMSPWHVYDKKLKQGEWRGWADWLGVEVSAWTRTNLLAFLEDLRPRLGALEETELYLILQQGGAMPGLRKALGKTTALGVLKDLQENDGRAIEAALEAATEEEVLEDYDNDGSPVDGATDAVLEEHTPDDEELHEDILEKGGLAALAIPEALRLVDDLAGLHYGLDDETAQYLVDNRVAALWEAYTATEEVALDALGGEGGYYFNLIRDRFYAELDGAKSLPLPAGWSFRPPGRDHEAPTPPNLMQRRTAHAISVGKRLGNWSGVGTGKTLAGILASRVTSRMHTLVICNKATVAGWCHEIRRTFPDAVVRTSVDGPSRNYTVLNYDKFQQRDRRQIVESLLALTPDFVILDEVQFVKQRDKNISARRQAIHALLSELEERNPDLHVLGMSATPVINTLMEARRLIEIVTGRTFADLDVKATVNNALAMHRTLMIHGLRYRPRYEQETTTETPVVTHNELADTLRAGTGVLHLEQTLLPAKLEAVRGSIRPGTILYTHYVEGMTEPTRAYVERMGLRVGMYTGDDKTGLRDLLEGRVDVLVGSRPVGTGLDGLQRVCDQIIFLSLPWTSAEYEQTVGRIRRQGSAFGSVRVIVPQVNLDHDGDVWSWDGRRMDTIRFKRTLSDCALDGNIPEVAKISPKELETRGRDALEAWILRVREGASSVGVERPRLRVPLPPEVKERLQVSRGDFTTLNNRWSSANSETVHTRLKDDPAEWYLYHTLYREAREGWSEVPAVRIAEDLKARADLRVGDFGAGECLLRDALPDHDVVSLDHVALDDGVIACDMASTPLQDGELGAAVFSLSLMGRNWRDYLAEAHRSLQPYGLLFIAEPARRWEGREDLEEAVRDAGFELLPTTRRGDFLYLRGIKV